MSEQMTSEEGVERSIMRDNHAVESDDEQSITTESNEQVAWAELATTLEDVWDIAHGLSEDESKSPRGVHLLENKLRRKDVRKFDALEGVLELADLDEAHIADTYAELITVARSFEQREQFIHQVTDPKVSSGSAKKLYSVLSKGLRAQSVFDQEDR